MPIQASGQLKQQQPQA